MRERNKASKKVRTEQEIEKKVVILTFHKVPGTNQSSTPPKITMENHCVY